jgi:RNA polymerase sigma-70 factor (ECF subfamily)
LATDIEIAALIGRVALRDRAGLAALYAAVSPKLFSVCLRILKDRADAEDALQEIFVKIWQRADRFAASGAARNQAIDLMRARKPVADSIDETWDIADAALDPETTTVLKGEGKRIDRCMEELESERASAVRSAYVEGLSYQELADRHGVPLNTVRTWLRRSLLKLRECLDR